MKASLFYRIASVLLVLFAVGHTLGFRQSDPSWGVDGLLSSMRSIHFDAQGFNRTYWDFFSGFGLFFSVFLLFAAVLAWLLARLNCRIKFLAITQSQIAAFPERGCPKKSSKGFPNTQICQRF